MMQILNIVLFEIQVKLNSGKHIHIELLTPKNALKLMKSYGFLDFQEFHLSLSLSKTF